MMNNIGEIIGQVEQYVRKSLSGHDSGHGWYHVESVVRLALYIHDCEKTGDRLIVELGALMHDVGDHKFGHHDGPKEIRKYLGDLNVDEHIIEQVVYINENISFSKKTRSLHKSDEMKIVQDADRLEAMGAIGIARAFNYGGFKGRDIYDPIVGYIDPGSFTAALPSSSSTIHHFYEKLLILKDLMNTKTGMKMAEERHDFMVKYLQQFYREWYPGEK